MAGTGGHGHERPGIDEVCARAFSPDVPTRILEPSRGHSPGNTPKTKGVEFKYKSAGIDLPVSELKAHIKKVAESMLYQWEHFPLLPPTYHTEVKVEQDLFKEPTFNEMREVAMGPDGNLKKLNKQQLQSIGNDGEFDVDSINFPGQSHRWRLSVFLQKGKVRSNNTFLNLMSHAARMLIIVAPNRIHSNMFCLTHAVKSIGVGLWQLMDMLIGMPHRMNEPGLEEKVCEQYWRHLVSELEVQPINQADYEKVEEYIKHRIELQSDPSALLQPSSPPSGPHLFTTTDGMDIDLKIHQLIHDYPRQAQRLKEVLTRITKDCMNGWFEDYRDQLIEEHQNSEEDQTDEELGKYITQCVQKEYENRVFSAIETDEELAQIYPKLGVLLLEHVKAVHIMTNEINKREIQLQMELDAYGSQLRQSYPVRGRINQWVGKHCDKFEKEFLRKNKWTAHENSIAQCEEEGLNQAAFFLIKDLAFQREMEEEWIKKLKKRIPMRTFSHSIIIWRPSQRIVTMYQNGHSTRIPTIIVDKKPIEESVPMNNKQRSYSVESVTNRTTTTWFPFWRWTNYFLRTFCWTANVMFVCGVVVPWCSPFSLRALFFCKEFSVVHELSQVNGALYKSERKKVKTVVSALKRLWGHVAASRRKFEATPDTGLLGKTVTRQFSRLWNYVVKGAMGTVVLLVGWPLTCISVSVLSTAAAITAPVWVPVASLLWQLFNYLIFDFDYPGGNRVMRLMEAVIWRLLICGLLQPVAALLTTFVFCPLSATLITLAGCIQRGLRGMWDSFVFYLVLRPLARVPATENFIARRIAGPGLASDYFYQIRPEQVLAAVECKMVIAELDAWSSNMQILLDHPGKEFRKFIKDCFSNFCCDLSGGEPYQAVEDYAYKKKEALQKLIHERKEPFVGVNISSNIGNRVKLTSQGLQATIALTATLLSDFYPGHVIARLKGGEKAFWSQKDLKPNDWKGLARQFLSTIFSSTILEPLEEADKSFSLKVKHLNLRRYTDMLMSANYRDDLDVVHANYTPKGGLHVARPRVVTNIQAYSYYPQRKGLQCRPALQLLSTYDVAVLLYAKSTGQDLNDIKKKI